MKIIFFAPHAAIWIHAFPEALVAEALKDEGHEIIYVTCSGQLSAGCIAMNSYGVSADAPIEQKIKVCRRCEGNKRILLHKFGFTSIDLNTLVSEEIVAKVRILLSEVTQKNFLGLEVAGIEVGRIALFEFLLEYKKSSLDFCSESEWLHYLASLENTLYSVFAGEHLIERETPDAVVVYNSLYSVNRVICKLAEIRSIPHYFMHAGGNLAHRLTTMIVAKNDIFCLLRQSIEYWPDYRDLPLSEKMATAITDHFIELLKGLNVFAYSPPRANKTYELRHKFGIAKNQKVLCATLSSYDERFAAETIGAREQITELLFPRQADWIRAIFEYISTRPDLYLIVRVHPREFPNKREKVKSAHAHQLEELMRNIPENAVINWPSDNLSLYDLAEVTDVFLNAWSGVGKEMSLLGLPVVLYSPDLPLYPAKINYVGTTHLSYFQAIENALTDGWRSDNIVRAYRWLAVEYGYILINISDSYKNIESAPNGLAQRTEVFLKRVIDPYWQQKKDCRNRTRPLSAQKQILELFESGASSLLVKRDKGSLTLPGGSSDISILRKEVKRLLVVMYPNGGEKTSRLGRMLSDFADEGHANQH